VCPAGQVLAGAGVDYDASLFNLLGADYVARLMHKTGGSEQALHCTHSLHDSDALPAGLLFTCNGSTCGSNSEPTL
jgi:hypothetical protein